jgi:RimJ/RimL family protein N-acetyltransferase
VIELCGGRVLLRGARPDEVDTALAHLAAPEIAAGDRVGVAAKRTRLGRSGERTEWELLFVIEAGGRLVGDVQGRSSRIAMPTGVWELGIEIWDEADRGKGYGREATALITAHLFEREAAIRIQASTDLGNVAMRRTLEGLGFGFEGVLRGFMPQADGEPRDYAMYGITRNDRMNGKDAWTRTV